MERQLKLIKQFQDKYPDSHVGGSIGLFLHGVYLTRNLKNSDIDMTVPYVIDRPDLENLEDTSDADDFDNMYKVFENAESSIYTKLDINYSKERKYVIIKNIDGIDYRVSIKEDILFFKKKYAAKGVQKHIKDMAEINGEPLPAPIPVSEEIDDLPF